jgi:hypothetical protein
MKVKQAKQILALMDDELELAFYDDEYNLFIPVDTIDIRPNANNNNKPVVLVTLEGEHLGWD